MATVAERIMIVVDKCEGGNKSAFARKIDVTPAYISKLGKNPDDVPTDRILKKISEVYNVNIDWLKQEVGPIDNEVSIAEEAGAIARAASKTDPDEAYHFFHNLVDGLTPAEIAIMYEAFKRWKERN